MKKLVKVLPIMGMILVLLVTTGAFASSNLGSGFYTGQTIQNVGVSPANISVTAYDSASTSTYNSTYTVAVGSSVTFFASDISGVPSGFQGSAVVSSDQPIRAVVNVTNRQSGSNGVAGGTAAAQYGGIDGSKTGTTISFPLAKSPFGIKETAFYIQNAGSASATFVATFLMGTSLTDPAPVTYVYTSPTSLAPGQMAVIIPADAGAPSGRIGSLRVTSAQPLAGTVLEYANNESPNLILQAATGIASADASTRILFPVVKKQLGGRSTGLQVQNVSGVSISVVMTYKGAGGTCPSGTFNESPVTLQPGQSTTYLDSALLTAGCLASAEASTTTPGGLIAGVVNESFLPLGAGQLQRSTTYGAFPSQNATNKVVAPVFKELFGSKISGLSLQNTGAGTATATVTFTVGTTNYVYQNLTIASGASATLLDMTNATVYPDANWVGGAAGRLPDGSLAAVTITANQPIIALINEAPTGSVVQDNINYEAFNQ
jgi:hypothetical protein